MIKIIIVDDEILARVGIQSLLEHCRDISVEGTFGMAQEALDFMRTHETDVVITDIEMPEMNGFEFIQIIQKEHLARGIMILSCYDSFEYAQKAISLGVDSYILKCDINQDTLKEELDSIIVKISRRQRKNPGITGEEELENDDRIKVIGVLKMSGDTDNSQEMLHEKIVLHLLEEIVAKYHMGYLLESYKRSPFVIFQFPEEKQMELKELLEGYVDIIVQNLLLYTNKKIYMGISGEFCNLQEIPDRFQEAEMASEQRFFDENDTVFWSESIEWSAKPPRLLFSDESFLEEEGMNIFEQELSEFLQLCFREHVFVSVIKETLSQSVNMLIYSILREYIRNRDTIQEWITRLCLPEILKKVYTVNELKVKTLIFIRDFRENLINKLSDDNFSDIYRFIDENLSGNLSLEDMADFSQQSISVFSKKFKEKTKMTPVQYLNTRRVEKVKEYLKKREYTLGEIAEIAGFSSENYMVRVFKKVTGKTITSYRRELEGTK